MSVTVRSPERPPRRGEARPEVAPEGKAAPETARAAAAAAAAPPEPPRVDASRARWIEARVGEMGKYAAFFYNLLLDRNLPDPYKEHAFGALWFMLAGGDVVPADDEDLAGVDVAAFAFRCLGELVGRLPQASLAVYEEVLHRDGIAVRALLPEAPANLGAFFAAVSAIYPGRVEKYRPVYKNAIQTGYLVKLLRQFLDSFRPEPWPEERLRRVETFLESFELKR